MDASAIGILSLLSLLRFSCRYHAYTCRHNTDIPEGAFCIILRRRRRKKKMKKKTGEEAHAGPVHLFYNKTATSISRPRDSKAGFFQPNSLTLRHYFALYRHAEALFSLHYTAEPPVARILPAQCLGAFREDSFVFELERESARALLIWILHVHLYFV